MEVVTENNLVRTSRDDRAKLLPPLDGCSHGGDHRDKGRDGHSGANWGLFDVPHRDHRHFLGAAMLITSITIGARR